MPRQGKSQAEAAKEQQNAQQNNSTRSEYSYKPSQWVTNRVKEFPFKEDLKRIYGVDLDAMLNESKQYGVLESIASSNFTLIPIEMKINEKEAFIKECIDKSRNKEGFNEAEQRAALQKWVPDTGYIKGFYTMRLWYIPNTDKWGVDKHEVRLGKKLDDSGQVTVVEKDGERTEKLTWDVNPLHEGSTIMFDGQRLSKDRMDHLRLTGTVGEPIKHKGLNDEEKDVLLFRDEFNHHELVVISVKYNESQLNSRLNGKNNIYVEGQGDKVFAISKEDNSISIAAAGGYIWVTNTKDPSEKINVWFNPLTRKFRPSIPSNPKLDFSMARNKEISDKSKSQGVEGNAQKQTKSQGRTAGKGKS